MRRRLKLSPCGQPDGLGALPASTVTTKPLTSDSAPRATAAHGRGERSRREDAPSSLLRDVLKAFRRLKQKYRTLFESDPKGFRRQIRRAEGRVFNRPRGPKSDPNIATAAVEVVLARAKMEDVFENRYSSSLKDVNPELYSMALESFRAKVNAYIRNNPKLKRLRDQQKKTREAVRKEPLKKSS